MKYIGLISDTHGYLDQKVFHYFENCDEIWHAGDIGSEEIISQLQAFKPLKAVYGNIDGGVVRRILPEEIIFECEGLKIYMIHIGGSPGKYNAKVKQAIKENQPAIFVCGHSHILKIITDPVFKPMLYLNPGAAGVHGFHQERTLLRFKIDAGKLSEMQVIELGKRSLIK